jgi:hypothetical protein
VTRLELRRQIARLQADDAVWGAAGSDSLVKALNAVRAQYRFRREHGTGLTALARPEGLGQVLRDAIRALPEEEIRRIRAGEL